MSNMVKWPGSYRYRLHLLAKSSRLATSDESSPPVRGHDRLGLEASAEQPRRRALNLVTERGHSFIGVGLRSSAANLALPLSSLITGPLLARTLEPSGRGAMAALLAPISLVNLAVTLGAPESMTYFVARGRLSRRQARQVAVASTVICGFVAIAVLAIVTPYLLRKYESLQDEFLLMLLSLPLTLGFASVRGAVLGMRKFDLISLERTLGAGVRLLAIVGAAELGLLTASSAAWITILSGLAASFVLLYGFRRWAFPATQRVGAGEVSTVRRRLRTGISGRVPRATPRPITDGAALSAEQLGLYAVAVSLAELPIFVVSAVRESYSRSHRARTMLEYLHVLRV